MIVLDHYRPKKINTNYCAYAVPVGSRPDVLYAFNENGALAFAHSRGDGSGQARDNKTVSRPFSQVMSPGAMVDHLIDQVGVSVVVPDTARPVAQLQPLGYNRPVFSGWFQPGYQARDVTRSGVYRPRYGASTAESPVMALLSSDDVAERRHGLFLAHVPDFKRRTIAAGPDGRVAVGRLCNQYSSPVEIGRTIPVDFKTQPQLLACVGDSGHGVWAAYGDELAHLPDDSGAEARRYDGVFVNDQTSSMMSKQLEPGGLWAIGSPPIYAMSTNFAFRVLFHEDRNRNVELVVGRASLRCSGQVENLDPLRIPTDLPPSNVFRPGICTFVSSTEDVLMIYIPIQGSFGGVRVISVDIE